MEFYRKEIQLDEYEGDLKLEGLVILGQYRRSGEYRVRLAVFCLKCSEDPELFGDGIFDITEKSLKEGAVPCGCSKSPQWNDDQWMTKVKRRVEHFGFTFVDWATNNSFSYRKPLLLCDKHGEWIANTSNDCKRYNIVCPECWKEAASGRNRKDDSLLIQKFLESGSFDKGTIFTRSERKSKSGWKESWNVWCPTCECEYVSKYSHLCKGVRSCGCSNFRQKELYIHFIYDNELAIAFKFGIANNYKTRLKELQRSCTFKVENYAVWIFDSIVKCKETEFYLHNLLDTPALSRQDMPDGWTETAFIYDLDKAVEYLDSITNRLA